MKVNVVNEGIKWGLIGGLIFLVITYGAWGLLDTNGFVSFTSIAGFIPYMIVILIVIGLQIRKRNEGVLPYKEALKFVFLAYTIIALTEAVGTYVLYNVLDHDLTAKVFEIGKEKARKMMEMFGQSEEKTEEAMSKMDKESKQTGLKVVFLGLGYNLIWYFVKSLLIALVIRKEEKFSD
jgi:hypothetical protein